MNELYDPSAGRELPVHVGAAFLDYLQTVAVALETLERMVHNEDGAKMADVVRIGRAAMTGLVGLVNNRADTVTPMRREEHREDESLDRGRRHGLRRRVVDGVGDVRP